MFIPAIGIDDLIIPNLELRAAILSTLEAASVLELLLRAEALTAGRVALYAASCRFLEALKSPVFVDQQTSAWAILKFHMLMHCINGTSKAAPCCSNASRFEAFLKAVDSRVGKLVSGRRAPLRDVVQHYIERLAYSILRARGGETAAALSRAAIPARQRINAWCSASSTLPLLYRPAEAGKHELPAPAVVADCLQ